MTNTSNSRKNTSDKAAHDTAAFAAAPRKKVYVGMSGGVDSSVAAALLQRAGFDVTGVFIKVWQPDETDCGWKDERRDAMRVAATLDIPFKTFDFSAEYKREVVDYMIDEYKSGRTPNPDIMCNRHVKFGSFLKQALADGVDYVATGHYAQNIRQADGTYRLVESKDENKDQTYFLWTLNQADLEHVLFPIGHLEKPEVRKLAEDFGLPVFDKKDSQGVCFIGHLDMKAFLKEHIHPEKGQVLNQEGEPVGEHDGAVLYTVGERHGFRLFNTTSDSQPHYVIGKDAGKNTITVAPEDLFKKDIEKFVPKVVKAHKLNWVSEAPADGAKIGVRIRYRQELQACTISHKDGSVTISFDKPQKGMASGQSAVFYDGKTCLGGGILQA